MEEIDTKLVRFRVIVISFCFSNRTFKNSIIYCKIIFNIKNSMFLGDSLGDLIRNLIDLIMPF